MPIVLIVVALVVAYFWLAGHWFGRIIAFVVFGAALSFAGFAFIDAANDWAIVALVGGWAIAWFIASAPLAYWNRRAREGWQVVA